MENTEREFRALLESSQNDPDYFAQKLALDISLRISQQLKSLAMTRKAFAARIEVSGGRVTQMLSGDCNLTLLSLCRLALGVGLRPDITFSSIADINVSALPTIVERAIGREMYAVGEEEVVLAHYAAVNQVLKSRIPIRHPDTEVAVKSSVADYAVAG